MLEPTTLAVSSANPDVRYENRFAKIEQDFAALKTDMTAIKWMIGVNLAASISIVVKVFYVIPQKPRRTE